MKPICFSPHAESDLTARSIDRRGAGGAIREPGRFEREIATKEYFDKTEGALVLLRVVLEETDREITVVTLYKTSKRRKCLPEQIP